MRKRRPGRTPLYYNGCLLETADYCGGGVAVLGGGVVVGVLVVPAGVLEGIVWLGVCVAGMDVVPLFIVPAGCAVCPCPV